MATYNYKGETFQLYTGPKGGQYILVNNKKRYVKQKNTLEVQPKEKNIRKNSFKSASGNKEARGSSVDDQIPAWISLSCNVPDVEHEGDIDYDLGQLRKIGPIKDVHIEREYEDSGEELIYACINFKCKKEDYQKFNEYCEDNL